MTPERWAEVERVYHAALTREVGERMAFLREACVGDEGLRREVEALLAQSASGDFMARPVIAVAADLVSTPGASVLTGRRIGVYQIQALLGAGGMGEVYRARDTKLGREVAIKILPSEFTSHPDRLARFQREARVLASLNHPHIGAIYSIEDAPCEAGPHVHALVLELVEGQTLADRIARGAVPIADALVIARQIADALDAAHEKGIVHRDLKPANIKVAPNGDVKVLDFGLAKAASIDGVAADLTQSPTVTVGGTRDGVILGTAAYMSPEQARGKPVDKRTDVWAFGCVLYEMLAGRVVFPGDTISDTIAAILDREPEWAALPTGTTPTVLHLLQRCLEKDVRRRLRDIGDALAELDTAPPLDQPAAETTPIRSSRWRRALGIGVVSFGAVVTIGGFTINRLSKSTSLLTGSTSHTAVMQLTNYGGTEGSGALSPDGRSFAFVSDHGGSPDMWRRQVSGGEPVRLTNDEAAETNLAFSPDGETIYFTRVDRGETTIWRVGALGGQALKVVDDAQLPAPSPDGRRIAYIANEHGPGASGTLMVSALDGSQARKVATRIVTVGGGPPSWSRNSRWIAYVRSPLLAPRNLFVIDLTTGEDRQLTHFARSNEGIYGHAWLPDDRHLVVSYAPYTRGLSNTADLGVLDTEAGSVTRLTMNVADGFGFPSLSADGKRLLASASRSQVEVWRVPLGADPETNGRQATRLFDATEDAFWLFVPHDGRTLLFNSGKSGSRNLWTMPLDGTAPARQITAILGEAVTHSSLSPDGTRVAFASSSSGDSHIWTQNVDGSDLRQLTNAAGADSWPVWSPDGKSIVFGSFLPDGRTEARMVPAAGGIAEKLIDGGFRGDWIRQPTGTGTWIVSSTGASVRLIDVERRTVVWEKRRDGTGNAVPMFSPDGRTVSAVIQDGRGRNAVWLFDSATGESKLGVRFPGPFVLSFRASWVDGAKALIVNRMQTVSHIVLLDRFWEPVTEQEH